MSHHEAVGTVASLTYGQNCESSVDVIGANVLREMMDEDKKLS